MHENAKRIYETAKGYAVYWFTKAEGMVIYRIYYTDGSTPLATNAMSIIEKELQVKKQLTLF